MNATRSPARLAARFAVPGEPSRPLQLSCQALLDGRSVTRRLARELPAIAADLIEISARVHAVDRLVQRPSVQAADAGSTWARNLWVEMPVREPQLWNAHAERLMELLAWLTDDTWNLEFFQLSEGAGPLDESQGFLFDTVPHGSAPVLFSGGLDSTAGLAAHLVDGDAVAISVDTNNWMQHVQQRVLQNLQALSGHRCVPLRYRVSVGASSVESSQRSRGLLFLAVGIATSWAMLWQVTRLRACLAQPDPWIGLVSEFPEILDTAPLAPTDVISLYRSYVREWEGLEATSETGGRLERQGRAAL